jgi:hypothetical protein
VRILIDTAQALNAKQDRSKIASKVLLILSVLLCLLQARARTRVGNVVEQCGRYIKLLTAPGVCVYYWRLEHLVDIYLFSLFRWAPWFTVDGEDLIQDPNKPNATTSFRKMFLLGKKICDTYAIFLLGKKICDTYAKPCTFTDCFLQLLTMFREPVVCAASGKAPKTPLARAGGGAVSGGGQDGSSACSACDGRSNFCLLRVPKSAGRA